MSDQASDINVQCGGCGASVAPGPFCRRCGRSLGHASADSPPSATAVPPPSDPGSAGSGTLRPLLISLLIAAGVLLGGGLVLLIASGRGSEETAAESEQVANPAAMFCEEQGGRVFGAEPMCELPDGKTVEAWDYYRSSTSEGATAPTTIEPDETPPTTAVPAAVAPASPAPSLEALTGEKAFHSEVSEGPCGTFAVIVEGRSPEDGRWVGPVLYEWNGAEWASAQFDPGPFPIGDREAENLPEPAGVTSGDFTGDGVIEFLVTYSAFSSYGGSYSFSSVLFPRADVLGDTYYDCLWGWSSFRSDIFDLPYPQTLRHLEFEDGTLKEGPDRAVTFDPIDEIFDLDNAIVSACSNSNGRDTGCSSEFEPSLWVINACKSGESSRDQCEGMEHPDDFQSDAPVQAGCADYYYDDELPIYVCSQGFSVEMFQDSLGLDPDGYFGPGTEVAVRDFQASVGLLATGVIDAATWAALGVTELAPFPDLNGDGVIDGSEFP